MSIDGPFAAAQTRTTRVGVGLYRMKIVRLGGLFGRCRGGCVSEVGKLLNEIIFDVFERARVATKVATVGFDVNFGDFLLEQIVFVEEEYELDRSEILVVDQSFEHFARLVETICRRVLAQVLVELARRGQKQYGRHVRKTLMPLLTLRSLTANVDESKRHTFYFHFHFVYRRRGSSGSQYVRQRRNVILTAIKIFN